MWGGFKSGFGKGAIYGTAQWGQYAAKNNLNFWNGRPGQQSLSVPNNLPRNIHDGQQGKHIAGHNNYGPQRSTLNSDVDPQALLDGVHSGKYQILRQHTDGSMTVDFGKPIGLNIYKGNVVGMSQYGTIKYGADGAHIYPANPVQY